MRGGADRDTEGDASKLIDLKNYCAAHLGPDEPYCSLRELMALGGLKASDGSVHKFRSSFRIIADNPIVRTEGGFVIGTGFKVEYTIEGTPEFDEYLRRYRDLTSRGGDQRPTFASSDYRQRAGRLSSFVDHASIADSL